MGELYELFEQVRFRTLSFDSMPTVIASQYAAEMWPSDSSTSSEATELVGDSEDDEADDDRPLVRPSAASGKLLAEL